MKKLGVSFIFLAGACLAQQWEFGALAGGSFLNDVNVTGPSGSAKAGFQPGVVLGAYLGQRMGAHFDGQVRYEFMQSNLQLSSGGSTANFGGQAHAIHYDVIWHTKSEGSVQFFAAVGGGMKIFQGTGTEAAYQPLSQFGYFTKTHVVKPMASVGGGLTFRLSQHVFLRTEVRDFITPFPTQLITPAPNTKYGSLLNDLVPMVGVEYRN